MALLVALPLQAVETAWARAIGPGHVHLGGAAGQVDPGHPADEHGGPDDHDLHHEPHAEPNPEPHPDPHHHPHDRPGGVGHHHHPPGDPDAASAVPVIDGEPVDAPRHDPAGKRVVLDHEAASPALMPDAPAATHDRWHKAPPLWMVSHPSTPLERPPR